MLKVVFIGEEAAVDGGPRREIFKLLQKEAFTLSSGWPRNVTQIHNVVAVAANSYYVIGKMISTSLIQSGQPPVCFSVAVARYIVFDEVKSKRNIDDIPNYCLRQTLLTVG